MPPRSILDGSEILDAVVRYVYELVNLSGPVQESDREFADVFKQVRGALTAAGLEDLALDLEAAVNGCVAAATWAAFLAGLDMDLNKLLVEAAASRMERRAAQ